MERKDSACLWIFIIVLAIAAVYFGFLKPKKGATLGDMATGDGLEVDIRCIDKKIDGRYLLSIVTKKATYKPWEKQELEYKYEFDLIKDGCTISGENAKRLGSTTLLDTINISSKRSPLNPNDSANVNIDGEIEQDTLILNVRVNTDNPQDCKLTAKFILKEKIQTDGKFYGKNCGLLYGTAQIKKK